MDGININLDGLIELIKSHTPSLIAAILLLVIGLWVIRKITKIVSLALERSGISEEIRPFILSFFSMAMKVLLIFSAAGIIGIETTSFVAALAAIGFAVGMALQGSLGNIASGIMVLIFKPYKIGDYITVGEYEGFVKEIQIVNTVITTLNNKDVVVPNSMAFGDIIVNSTGEDGFIRLEFEVYMPYDESFDRVKEIIRKSLANIKGIMTDPEPFVGIEGFDSHSIRLMVKPYALIEDAEFAYYRSTEAVKAALGEHRIKVAYSEGVEMGNIAK